MYPRSELDYLIYNAPLIYADLILNGNPETYLKTVTECRIRLINNTACADSEKSVQAVFLFIDSALYNIVIGRSKVHNIFLYYQQGVLHEFLFRQLLLHGIPQFCHRNDTKQDDG